MNKKALYRTGGSQREWEYMVVDCEHFAGDYRPKYRDGEPVKDWSIGLTVPEFLTELGAERWELVTATPRVEAEAQIGQGARRLDRLYLIFKRPTD